jgi:hypothetical protein
MSDETDAIDEIVAVLAAQYRSWPRAGGWAPSNASALLEVARLDRQLSFAHTLRDCLAPFPRESADARQILAYVTLRSLCEGEIQLFITVYYNVYIADKKPITRRNRNTGEAKTVDPEDAHLNELIAFYLRNGDPAFESFLERVKTRGNAIHHFRERNIGTQDELKEDIVRLRDFLVSIDRQLPDPPPLPDPDPDW